MAVYVLDYLAELVRQGDVTAEAAFREELREPLRRYVRRALQPDTVSTLQVDEIRTHARKLVADSGGVAAGKRLVDLVTDQLCEQVVHDLKARGLGRRT